LRLAARDPGLAESVVAQAAALADRLENGVTVAVLGPKGGGKSALLEVILRQTLDPVADDTAAATLYAGSSRAATWSGDAPGPVAQCLMVSPLAEYARFLDVHGHADAQQHAERHFWALDNADLVLWCGQGFEKSDLDQWCWASDLLKDHSFLVLTKADELAEAGTLKNRLLCLQAVAAEEFHSVFPTTTLQARRELASGKGVTDAGFAASGVKALCDALLRLVRSGQQADMDGALLFLERYGIPEVTSEAAQTFETARSYDAALTLIRTRAKALAKDASAVSDDGLAEAILSQCGALSEDLVALIEQDEEGGVQDPALRDEVLEASDKIVLMGLEADMRSAADAVTILLQLSREFEQHTHH
jgi:hypothetical protein